MRRNVFTTSTRLFRSLQRLSDRFGQNRCAAHKLTNSWRTECHNVISAVEHQDTLPAAYPTMPLLDPTPPWERSADQTPAKEETDEPWMYVAWCGTETGEVYWRRRVSHQEDAGMRCLARTWHWFVWGVVGLIWQANQRFEQQKNTSINERVFRRTVQCPPSGCFTGWQERESRWLSSGESNTNSWILQL